MFKPMPINKNKLLGLFIISFMTNAAFIFKLYLTGIPNRPPSSLGLAALTISTIFVLGVNFLMNFDPPQLKNNLTLFCISLLLYNFSCSSILPYNFNLIVYCAGIMFNTVCSINCLYLYFTWEQIVTKNGKHKGRRHIRRDAVRVKHSRLPVTISLFISMTVVSLPLFFARYGPSFIETMKKPGFIVYIVIFSFFGSLFFSKKLCKNSDVKLDGHGIYAINNFVYGFVSVEWKEIERLSFINLFLVQIIIIHQNNSRTKPWLDHFSFTSLEIKNAIKKFRPDLIVN